MNFGPGLFKSLAVCSFATALIVILANGVFPLFISEDLPQHENVFYHLSEWGKFTGVILGFLAIWGIAARKLNTHPGLAATGLLFFIVWLMSELIFRSIRVVVGINSWMPALATATDDATTTMLQTNLSFYNALTNALVFVVFLCVVIGGILLALATWNGKGLEKLSSIFLFLYAAMGIISIAGQFGLTGFSGYVETVYPFQRSLDRIVWGLWLWTSADRLST